MGHEIFFNDYKLYQTLSQSNNHYSGSSVSYATKTCSTLKPPNNLSNLFNEDVTSFLSNLFNFSSQQNKDTKNIIDRKYYNIEEIQSLKGTLTDIYKTVFRKILFM